MTFSRLVLVLMIVLSACTSEGEAEVKDNASEFGLVDTVSTDVMMSFDKPTYAHGEVGTVTVVNNTDRDLYYHLGCQSEIEGDNGKQWVHVYRLDCSTMRVRPTILKPGESAKERYAIPLAAEMSPAKCAEYRLRLVIDGDSYFSNPFKIHDGE